MYPDFEIVKIGMHTSSTFFLWSGIQDFYHYLFLGL